MNRKITLRGTTEAIMVSVTRLRDNRIPFIRFNWSSRKVVEAAQRVHEEQIGGATTYIPIHLFLTIRERDYGLVKLNITTEIIG